MGKRGRANRSTNHIIVGPWKGSSAKQVKPRLWDLLWRKENAAAGIVGFLTNLVYDVVKFLLGAFIAWLLLKEKTAAAMATAPDYMVHVLGKTHVVLSSLLA